MKVWSPHNIMVLIHIRTSVDNGDFPWPWRAPATKDSIASLETHGLIAQNRGGGWEATEAGIALVDALCSTPAPVCRWIDPRFDYKQEKMAG